MNPLTKLVLLATVVGSIAVGIAPTAQLYSIREANSAFSPARLVEQVAVEVKATVVTSLSVVRLPARARTAVFVEGNHMIIEAPRFDVLKLTDVIAQLRDGVRL